MTELPPLHALRAFEAAARLESFKLAAAELFVTPGAISQQVKALEEALGRALFLRRTRAVALTEAGRELLPAVQEAFTGIARATARLRERERSGPLVVSVLPS
jgi:LysR family glycine cleavage system transcriptional activator